MLLRILLKRVLLPIAILGALFLIANVFVQRVAEDRIAQAVQTSFDLQAPPEVEISGFPIIVRVLTGSLPSLSFEANDVEVEGLRIASLVARLEDIEAENGLLQSSSLSVVIGRGELRGQVTEDEINRYLEEQGEDASITLAENNLATVRTSGTFGRGTRRSVMASGTVRLTQRGQLRFDPETVTVAGRDPPPGTEEAVKREATITVDLPDLPGGIRITRLQTGDGTLTLLALLENYVFPPAQEI